MEPTNAEEIAVRQIEPGERLLWTGSPRPGAAAALALPGTLLGIPFTGFAAFWIWTAADSMIATHRSGPWSLFPLFGVPFLLIGVGMLLAPLWAWLRARGTVYAVTERRALIIVGGGSGGVSSYGREDLQQLLRVEGADGSGSLYFAWRTPVSSRGFDPRTRLGFVGIADVRRVERLIRDHILERAA